MNSLQNKYKLSEDFQEFLVRTSEGFLSSEQFDKLYNRFELNGTKFHFTPSSEANLIRIISSLFDKKSFLLNAIKFEHHIEVVSAVSSFSNYLTDIIVRNSEYLYLIFDQEFLVSVFDQRVIYEEIKKSVSSFKKIESKSKLLRNFKRKYLLKIGVADILGFTNLKVTTKNLSTLANVLSTVLFEECIKEIELKYNEKLSEEYALCSLGKLGGNELNYSSDIDLIIFYRENYVIDGIGKEYHELITEAIHLFIREATQITSASYIYRVDFRLRPDGRNSLLTRTLGDYLRYYETRGEEWERQMLIKLDYICGDKILYSQFRKFLEGFIYPKSYSDSITHVIRKMKSSIEERSTDGHNIKLSAGGIRDIEFTVQALQLINGGKLPAIRTGNTLHAIENLLENNLLAKEEAKLLTDSYIFYRKIEHFVQLMNDKQTHTIPQSGETLKKLISYLRFNNKAAFDNKLENLKTGIRKIYDNVTQSGEASSNRLSLINFHDKIRAKNDYDFLSKGISLFGEKQFDTKTRVEFQKIENYLLNFLNTSQNPDLALENFAKIIKHVKMPSIWYSSFQDELFFKSFLKICQFSQSSVDMITTSPKLGDLLLSKNVFQSNYETTRIDESILSLSVQHSLSKNHFPTFSMNLCRSIEKSITDLLEKTEIDFKFFIAGLGSFGNSEMSFGSDIDLIVVVENLQYAQNAEKEFQNLLGELRKRIPQFEIDFRLRPEGKNSPLVTDMPGYQKYIKDRMRIWEFQALSKAKLIYGDKNLFSQFMGNVETHFENFSNEQILEETLNLYRSKINLGISSNQKINLKSNPGGLLTVDTIIQLLLSIDKRVYQSFRNLGAPEKLEILVDENKKLFHDQFVENYIFIKNVQIGLQNLINQKKSTFPSNKNRIENLAAYLRMENSEKLIRKIREIFNNNVETLNKVKERI